jgi:hypothetical protein
MMMNEKSRLAAEDVVVNPGGECRMWLDCYYRVGSPRSDFRCDAKVPRRVAQHASRKHVGRARVGNSSNFNSRMSPRLEAASVLGSPRPNDPAFMTREQREGVPRGRIIFYRKHMEVSDLHEAVRKTTSRWVDNRRFGPRSDVQPGPSPNCEARAPEHCGACRDSVVHFRAVR